MRRPVLLVAALCTLSGCQSLDDVGREPELSPVGAGYALARHDPPSALPGNGRRTFNSLWRDDRRDLFRDGRARTLGDVVTVDIRINDRATLDNASARERASKSAFGLDLLFGGTETVAEASGDFTVEGSSRASGSGSVDRKEEIRLSMAATVVEVLPGEKLLVAGIQEVRVNNEVRVLRMSGIVRARDIAPDNTIAYDQIAEARISYGGRGRISEFQQPPTVQQVYDRLAPY